MQCPTSRELDDFLAGEPLADARGELNAHLQRCGSCREILDRLSDEPELRRWAGDAPRSDVGVSDGPGLARLLEIGAKMGMESTLTEGRRPSHPRSSFSGRPAMKETLARWAPIACSSFWATGAWESCSGGATTCWTGWWL